MNCLDCDDEKRMAVGVVRPTPMVGVGVAEPPTARFFYLSRYGPFI
jgi:hypothetical protein